MTKDILRYDRMIESAYRGVIREALSYVAKHGLPGRHHFYITFRTGAPGVVVPDSLRERFPDQMTIVLEHQFWDLSVDDDTLAVTLSFQKQPERLTVPLAAITAFSDPSVKFGLQFQEAAEPGVQAPAKPAAERRDTGGATPETKGETMGSVPLIPAPAAGAKEPAAAKEKPPGKKQPGEVVTLDTFRKK
jgi:hypothetical protein